MQLGLLLEVIKMTRTILIAEDKITAPVVDLFDYIYDEYSNLDELAEGIGANLIPCASSWRIVVFTPELFYKFREDFIKIYDDFPLLEEFEDVSYIVYVSLDGEFNNYKVEYPSWEDIRNFEKRMEKDSEIWEKYKRQKSQEN